MSGGNPDPARCRSPGYGSCVECVVREVRQRERVVATLGPAHRGRLAQ